MIFPQVHSPPSPPDIGADPLDSSNSFTLYAGDPSISSGGGGSWFSALGSPSGWTGLRNETWKEGEIR